MPLTNEERAVFAAQQIKNALASLRSSQPEGAPPNPFASFGPSQDFLATHLPGNVASEEDIVAIESKIDAAIANGDMQTINSILGAFTENLIPGLKGVFGLLT